MRREDLRLPALAAAVLLLCVYGALIITSRFGIIDDAFISLRYARNLAAGQGLVFNPGERVEGYTNFLWTLLLAPGFFLPIDMARAAVVASAGAGAATLLVLFAVARRFISPAGGSLLPLQAPLFVAVQFPFLCYSLSGLESSFYLLLVSLGIGALLAGLERPERLPLAALLFAAAGLTRPEGNVLFLYSFLFCVALALARGRLRRDGPLLLLAAGLYGVLVCGHFLWRHFYYGDWLPNTYYAKVGTIGTAEVFARGAAYVAAYGRLTGLGLVVPAAILLGLYRRDSRILYLGGLAVAAAAATLVEGGDHMALFRFMLPVLPAASLLALALAEAGVARLRRVPALAVASGPLLAAILLLWGVGASLRTGHALGSNDLTEAARAREEVLWAKNWAGFGEWLRDYSGGRGSIALLTAGAIPFYSGLETVDVIGLTDGHIAHLDLPLGRGYAGHEKFDNAYVLGRRPRFILASHKVHFEKCPGPAEYARAAFFPVHQDLLRRVNLDRGYRYRCVDVGPRTAYAFFERQEDNKERP